MKEEWISVKDRLPEHYVSVLVFDPKEQIPYAIDFYTGKYWGNRFDTVTHWMPLPSPPKT